MPITMRCSHGIPRVLVFRGFMESEAFDKDTYAGTAKRESQRMLASEAACNEGWITASMDIDKAFFKGLSYSIISSHIP